MYRILIVEDDVGIATSIKEHAENWDFKALCAKDFRNILTDFTSFEPHIVLMDIALPFYNGYHWCNEIRKISKVPIIFLSSASDSMNIVLAMSMGGDDFLSKPFDISVLLAKIQALLRRSYDFTTEMHIMKHSGVFLDINKQTVQYENHSISLTKNEYRILYVLMQEKGKVVSREKLMEHLWQTDSFVDDNTLTVNVNRLRKKLEVAGISNFITTRFKEGYIIV